MAATLNAEKRDTRGKNEARRLRVAGRIPATVYGGAAGEAAVAVAVEPKVLSRILHSESGVNTLIDLSIAGGDAVKVMVKEFQLNPVTHHLLHADFYRIALDRPIEVGVQVHLTGEPKGVKVQGGILDFVTREIQIEVLPTQIPEQITVDVSELLIGQAVRVRDVSKDAAWKPLSDLDVVIASVSALRATAEETAAAEAGTPAATAEPEVIKKGKPEKADEKA
jgi:large subunit ribosomal protein L25